MIVVSDTTPLISLMKAEQLDVLQKLFGVIIIPQAVYDELTSNTIYEQEADIIRNCKFIQKVVIDDRKSVDLLRRATGLDLGESEAIIYSDETKAELLIMDEVKGRNIAKQMSIRVVGTIGILQLANEKGILSGSEVRRCIDVFRNSKRHISEEIYNDILSRLKD